jgi:hypothetical protein
MIGDELELIWNEATPQHLPVGTEKYIEYPHSVQEVSWPQLEPSISQVQLLSSGKKVRL